MNNTKKRTLTAIAAILMAATLVVGTAGTVTTKTAFAAASSNNNRSGNTVTIEECKNRGSASGFDTATNQECENLICTHPGNNATCVQEGAAAAAPVKLTCEQCFTKFLSSTQITTLLAGADVNTLEQLCAALPTLISEAGLADFLEHTLGVSASVAAQLIQCLKDAGIVFSTENG